MSVMLRCTCGNEVTVPDEAGAGIVNCPICHQPIDAQRAVIHPRLDDLDPDLLLAPDDLGDAPSIVGASPMMNSKPPSPVDDDLLAFIDTDSNERAQDDGFELPPSNLTAASTPEASSLGAATPSIQPPQDDDDGYAIVEENYTASSAASWLDPSTDDISESPAAPPKRSTSEASTEPAQTKKPAAPPLPSGANQPATIDDLLDDEITLASEETPKAPAVVSCPECKAPINAGSVLCVSCGFNLKLGKKVTGAPPGKPAKGKKTKTAAAGKASKQTAGGFKAKLKDPRVAFPIGGGLLILVLVLVGLLFLGGSGKKNAPAPTAAAGTTTVAAGQQATVPGPGQPGAPSVAAPASVAPSAIEQDSTKPTLLLAAPPGSGRVSNLAFAPDGKWVAIGDESGTIQFWDLEKGEPKPPLHLTSPSPVQVSFDHEGKQLLTGFSGGAKLWDVPAGTEARAFKSPVDGLWAARFVDGDKQLITSGPSSLLSIVDLAAGGRTKMVSVDLARGIFPVVDFTSDGKAGLFGADEGALLVWDVTNSRLLKQLNGHTTKITAVAISPDGRYALSAAGGAEYRRQGNDRLLAGNRPTDFTVRLWDISSGHELFRMRATPDKPPTSLSFSPDGKHALIAAGDISLIDIATKQLLTTLSPTPPDTSGAPPAAPEAPKPPSEPFRLAMFSSDGKRMATVAGTSAVHLWSLPSKPEAKPLQGIAEPADLATFKPPAWSSISPLLLTPVAAPSDAEAAKRQAIAAKAAQVSAAKNPTIKALQKALATQPRTTDNLLKLAKLCRKKQLDLEAEECLRAVLMADPMNEEARHLYDDMRLAGPGGAGPVTLARSWPKEVPDLDDAGQRPDPPKNKIIFSVPIEVAVVDKITKLDPSSLTGKAGDEDAEFVGIYYRPTGEVQGARKGSSASGQQQVWEVMGVATNKSGEKVAQLVNRRIPQTDQPRGKQPAGASTAPKVKYVPDKTSVKEDYKGPYEALFAVPEGTTLSEIRYGETAPVRLLHEEPKSLDQLALASKTPKSERLAAIEALGTTPTPTATETLEKVVATGDDELFAAARNALRNVRRQTNALAPEYLPVPSEKSAKLMAISQGKIDSAGMPQPSASFAPPRGNEPPQTPPITSYNYCKMLWKLDAPGKYLARLATFGPGPEVSRLGASQFEFEAAEPNLYLVPIKFERDAPAEVQMTELWLDGKLLERRILSESPTAASAIAARVSLEPPHAAKEDEEESDGPLQPRNAFVAAAPHESPPLFTTEPVLVEAAAVFGSNPRGLPPAERAVLEEMVMRLPAADQGKIPAALVEIERLDMHNAPLTASAIQWLLNNLGDAAPAVFSRLADEASVPTSLAAIKALRTLGEKSADACRKLIDLQKGPADLQKAAEAAVNALMTDGVIAQTADNWRYHDQSHFAEKTKETQRAAKTTSTSD